MQLGMTSSATAPPATAGLPALLAAQPRFRVEGAGPLAQRQLVAATPAARALQERSPAVTDAVRGVLRLVEQVAGPDAAAALAVNGVAFSLDGAGHAANVFAAHADDDPQFVNAWRRADAAGKAQLAGSLARDALAEVPATKAMVTSGWLNAGPQVSSALLAAHAGAPRSEADLALAIRVLRHEAHHLADPSQPDLPGTGATGLREALAEAHSTHLPQLQAARRVLGMDALVNDDALEGALAVRPYPQLERTLARALATSGMQPLGAEAGRLLAQPARNVAEALVHAVSRAEGSSPAVVRRELAAAFALGGHAHG